MGLRLLPSGKEVKRILKKSFGAAKKKFVQSARTIARKNKRTGILAGSIGGKIKDYKDTVFGIFGVRDVKKPYGKGKQEWTRNIFHLVEFGTHRSQAKPFVTTALSQSEIAEIVSSETTRGIENELGK
jgi:hypothetical protein